MNQQYLKLRTAIVVVVIAIFGLSIHPLTPRDFYQTFRETLKNADDPTAAALIEDARERQAERPDSYPSVALLEAADSAGVELKNLVDGTDLADNSDVIALIRKKAASSIRLGLDLNGGVEFLLELEPDEEFLARFAPGASRTDREELEQRMSTDFARYRDLAMESLRKRLETQNIFESEITPFGARGLALRAPIVSKDEKDKLQKLIRMSCKLQFRLVHPDNQALQLRAAADPAGFVPPAGYDLMREVSRDGKDRTDRNFNLVSRKVEMDGRDIAEAMVVRDEFGQTKIALRFNSTGGERFAKVTADNVGRQLAIVLDGKLYCAPVIQGAIGGGRAEISGDFSREEAQNIADALSSGSFPFRINITAVYDTAPTLGADNVSNGIWAGLLALALLAAFMCIYYFRAGLIAMIALGVNVVLILGAMAATGATLTMPGIAGIILTMGMAVDANVLIFERIREELTAGKNLRTAVSLGYDKAFSAVFDGNITTLLIGLILMYFGTGPVKGFAVSLSIGILSSLFTALFMTRLIFDYALRYRNWQTLKMCRFFQNPQINFLKQAPRAFLLSGVMLLASFAVFFVKGENMLGVEFTGGTLLSYHYQENAPVATLEKALNDAGIHGRISYKSNASVADNRKLEVLIRRGGQGSLAAENLNAGVAEILNRAAPELQLADGQSTVVGGMVGREMSRSAAVAILLAFAGICVYVSLRYEFSYAVAGVLALLHDVIISLGIFILMGRELSLPVVAALLTIIGYSINDTIVIFDRIREDRRLMPGRDYREIINLSINRTLSRTILTSLTTFLVVVTMFFFGGIAINDFVLVMMLGIIIGTYSSIFIASPIVLAWHRK